MKMSSFLKQKQKYKGIKECSAFSELVFAQAAENDFSFQLST